MPLAVRRPWRRILVESAVVLLLLLQQVILLDAIDLRPAVDARVTIGSSSGGGASKVFEQLWESLSQHMQQQQPTQNSAKHSDGTASSSSEPEERRTLSAPHASTRGGAANRRRAALFQHSVHHHFRQRLGSLRQRYSDGGEASRKVTDYDKNHHVRPVLEHIYQTYVSTVQQRQHGTTNHTTPLSDRTDSLIAALPPFPESKRLANLQLLRDMFTHAYDSYMINAWPAPELKPLTCHPGSFDLVKLRGLTLIDTLDTLFVLQNYTEFARAIERIREEHTHAHFFDVDENVSLFETTIRVLGGLLSAHQLAVAYMVPPNRTTTTSSRQLLIRVPLHQVFDPETSQIIWGEAPELIETTTCASHDEDICDAVSCKGLFAAPFQQQCEPCVEQNQTHRDTTVYWQYDNILLEMALDIGERLFPAFSTKTGIPYGTVNLKHGVPHGETTVASLAGGGTLTLEFELLSRLTGEPKYGKAAKLASRALWMRRSKGSQELNLFGKHIDVQRGQWTETISGIGSNSDSFLEYLAKQYVLFPEDYDFWTMLSTAYAGVFENSRVGEWYVDTDMNAGVKSGKSRHVLESLMAFYPGMQVLLGEVSPAARSLNSFFLVRELLGFLPERFNFGNWNVDNSGRGYAALHPLRPELLESCYFLHRATCTTGATSGGGGWRWAADFALDKLHTVTHTECGYATISSLKPQTTGTVDGTMDPTAIHHENEMPSFFLSETLKYLYLTFDDENLLHQDDERQWIFTTEAHPIHYVPRHKKDDTEGRANDSAIKSVKRMLHDRLAGLNPRATLLLKDALTKDSWSDKTNRRVYFNDLEAARQDMVESSKATGDKPMFFEHRPILDSMPTSQTTNTFSELNWVHVALKNTGSGKSLRRACPNVYATDVIWTHALYGGAADYSDIYVSVTSDTVVDHSYVVLGAADALGMLGSGLYLGKEDVHTNTTCRVANVSSNKERVKPEKTAEPTADDTAGGPDLNQFQVTTFSDGGGFVVDNLSTGDKVISSFVFDEMQQSGDLYVLVYAGYSLKVDAKPDTTSAGSTKTVTTSSLWRMAGRRKLINTSNNNADKSAEPSSFRRKVVVADFEGNSFSCEIGLYRGDVDDDERIAAFPCAPGLFGQTHIRYLRATEDGIEVDAVVVPPLEDDELGCGPNGVTNETTINASHAAPLDAEKETVEEGEPPTLLLAGAIQVVYRGECTFLEKAIRTKKNHGAKAVIVINTEDDELFTMSNGDLQNDESGGSSDPESIPVAVLVTGLDGEDLLSIANSAAAEGGTVTARISLKREPTELRSGHKDDEWPIVLGTANSLQVLSKGGWGTYAVQQQHQQRKRGTAPDWTLHLLKYNE